MHKIDRRRIMSGPPCKIGSLGLLALLVVCLVFPDELFGYRTPYLFAGIFILVCSLGAAVWIAVSIVRAVFGRSAHDTGPRG